MTDTDTAAPSGTHLTPDQILTQSADDRRYRAKERREHATDLQKQADELNLKAAADEKAAVRYDEAASALRTLQASQAFAEAAGHQAEADVAKEADSAFFRHMDLAGFRVVRASSLDDALNQIFGAR